MARVFSAVWAVHASTTTTTTFQPPTTTTTFQPPTTTATFQPPTTTYWIDGNEYDENSFSNGLESNNIFGINKNPYDVKDNLKPSNLITSTIGYSIEKLFPNIYNYNSELEPTIPNNGYNNPYEVLLNEETKIYGNYFFNYNISLFSLKNKV